MAQRSVPACPRASPRITSAPAGRDLLAALRAIFYSAPNRHWIKSQDRRVIFLHLAPVAPFSRAGEAEQTIEFKSILASSMMDFGKKIFFSVIFPALSEKDRSCRPRRPDDLTRIMETPVHGEHHPS